MICSSLNRLLRTTPPPGPGRAILNGRSHISTGLISGGQVTLNNTSRRPLQKTHATRGRQSVNQAAARITGRLRSSLERF